LLVEVEVFSGALPLAFLLVGFVSSGSYSYPCMRPQSQQQFDQCDQRGRGTWATANCRATATIGFLARGACGEGSFSEDRSPFYNRFQRLSKVVLMFP